MNTAPKLSTIISRMKLMAGIGIPVKPECISAWAEELEQLALAPPSGEGVGLTVADAWFESPTEITIHAKASCGAKLPEEGTKIYTAPQSAPVDGGVGAGSGKLISDVMSHHAPKIVHKRGDSFPEYTYTREQVLSMLWDLQGNLNSPPPASQERGGISCYVGDMKTSAGMRYYVCIERNGETITPHEFGERYKAEYEVACWDAFFNDKPKPDILAYGPPSSATESEFGPITDLGEPDKVPAWAAEQAKPDDCPSCGQPQAGELPPRCAAARTLGNETLVEVALQAAGRASLIDSEIHRIRYSECRTELLRRLAGWGTVDYPMVHLALNAQPYIDKNDAMRVWQLFKDGVDSETAMRAALVAALGAK